MIVFQDSLRIIDRDGDKITITSIAAKKSLTLTLPVFLAKPSPAALEAARKGGFPTSAMKVATCGNGTILVHAAAVELIETLNAEKEKLNAAAADARFREKYADQIAEAARTGKPVRIDSYSYEGRGEDGMVYVDVMVRGDGSTFKNKTKTY